MVDFIGSFNKGQDAAIQAEKNKDEIDSVFDVMNLQLSEVSAGRLKVEIKLKSNPLFGLLAITGNAQDKGAYWALVASNPLAASFSPKEIAKWKSDPNGYPCQVITDVEEVYCEDRAALERALKYLLASPEVGKKFKEVMGQKLKDEPIEPA